MGIRRQLPAEYVHEDPSFLLFSFVLVFRHHFLYQIADVRTFVFRFLREFLYLLPEYLLVKCNLSANKNPLTDDIRVMFYKEYKVASCIGELLKERLQIEIDEHEIGYLALHVHSAIVEENVSQAMEVARAVRESISLVEHITGHTIDVMSLSYNRMMNHIRYMVARAVSGEKLKVNMNDYMSVKFPEAFRAAKRICEEMEKRLKLPMEEIEIGYLAMHIERIMDREEGE